MVDQVDELTRVRRERDLYRRLLDLSRADQIDKFLREALALIVEVTDARQGYLELHDDEREPSRWWIAHGLSDEQVQGVREISRSIIAEALATGKTVVTKSAQHDPKYSARDSVRLGQIDAVL